MIDDVTVYDVLLKLYEKQREGAMRGIIASFLGIMIVSLGWFVVQQIVKNSIMLYMLSVEFLAAIFFCVAVYSFFLGQYFLIGKEISLLHRVVKVNVRRE
ncbi:MAG: hypothetical protein ACP5GS_08670 [Nitrososphaeria archaeon]